MSSTRLVSIAQITEGPLAETPAAFLRQAKLAVAFAIRDGKALTYCIRARAVGDAAGGDVFEPVNSLEAGLAIALRDESWPHPVQVEMPE